MYETPDEILQAARKLQLPQERFRQVGPGRWQGVLDAILTRFTRTGDRNRSRRWLWEDFVEPTCSLQGEHGLEILLRMDEPHARVWLVVEDSARTKRNGNFWVFECDLAAAVGVLENGPLLEFYLVAGSLSWLIAENHHAVLIGVGPHAVQVLKAIAH